MLKKWIYENYEIYKDEFIYLASMRTIFIRPSNEESEVS